jgi:hypothetical protein
MKFGSIQFLSLSLVSCLLSLNFSHAKPPEPKDYIEFYNVHRGTYLRDHSGAKRALQEKFTDVILKDFDGDIGAFYQETLGAFATYRKNRGARKWVQDYFVSSTSKSCVEVMNEFVMQKTALALEAIHNQETIPQAIDDRVVAALVRSWNSSSEQHSMKNKFNGIRINAEDAANRAQSAQSQFSPAMGLASGVLVGAVLYWYGPALVMSVTKSVYPYVWSLIFKSPVPTAPSWSYAILHPSSMISYANYQTGLSHAMAQAYQYSTPILGGCWTLGTAAVYHVGNGIRYGALLAHRGGVQIYQYLASQSQCALPESQVALLDCSEPAAGSDELSTLTAPDLEYSVDPLFQQKALKISEIQLNDMADLTRDEKRE